MSPCHLLLQVVWFRMRASAKICSLPLAIALGCPRRECGCTETARWSSQSTDINSNGKQTGAEEPDSVPQDTREPREVVGKDG